MTLITKSNKKKTLLIKEEHFPLLIKEEHFPLLTMSLDPATLKIERGKKDLNIERKKKKETDKRGQIYNSPSKKIENLFLIKR